MDCIKKQFETLGINHQSDITAEEQRHPNNKHERDDRHHNLFLNGKPEGRSKFQHRDLRHGEYHHLCHPHRNPHRYRRSQLPNDTEMAPEEGNSPSHPHHQRRPPQKNHRYSGSKVDSEQYYHNPFYYRTHRNRANHLKNGGDTSGGFSFNHEALDNSEILYENIDDPMVSDSDIPQFHIPRRKDKKKEEDNYPLYHQTYLHPHHRDPPRGRDRRPRPNTNNPWPHPVPPPPLVPQTAALSSSTTSSQQKLSRRKEPVTRRFSATTSTGSPHLPRSRQIPLHYVPGHEPPNSELDTTTSSPPPPPPQGRRRRLSPPLFPLPAPTTTVDGGSVLMAGRGEKRSAGVKRGDRRDYNDKIRDQTSGGPLASDSPSPIRSFVPDGYEEGASDELLPPEPTEINGTELSLSVRKRNGADSGGGDGSLIYDGGSGGYDEEGYEGYGYEYVGPNYDGEEVIVVGGRGKGHEELWSPGWEVSSVRTFSDGGGGKRDNDEEGTSELIGGGSGRGRGFFDYARARARRKGERVRGATGHQVSGLGDDDGESYHFGRGGFETAGRGGGWETEPEQYLFDDEDFGGGVPRGWLPGRIERVDYEHGEDERARDKRKYRRKKHSDSNRTSTPPALPNGKVMGREDGKEKEKS
ncbi:uncharacterized protein LTHEOB_12357 [Lasiodiplodia theobromae]|uniref:uncharacterized protein n=1 Tax=Lasiodiplodia theobromae TaxID=45133 RepID=UPI0015C38AFA|nr:uncharacterized protein LTHEOB_12357 [Lasiodiplodia theobromae]KAF4536045.1 hypothetical protein LTHEOB_12357 [Lasiodiplodia theobromae]